MVFPDTVRPITVEVLINGTWMDITSYVLQRQSSVVNRGAGGEDNSMPPSTMTLLLRNDDGRFAQDNPMSPYWPYLKQGVQVRFKLTHSGVTYTRFWGETADAPMAVEADPKENTVTLECGGLFRRWERSKTIVSPLRRAILAAPQLVAYWPLEDAGSNAQTLASGIPGREPMLVRVAPDSFGSESGFIGSAPILSLGTGRLEGTVPAYTPNGAQYVQFLVKGPVSVDDTTIANVKFVGGSMSQINIFAHTNGDLRLRWYDSDGVVGGTSSYLGVHDINDRYIQLTLVLTQVGAHTTHSIATRDQDDPIASNTSNGNILNQSFGRIRIVTGGYFQNQDTPWGQVAVYNGLPSNNQTIIHEAFGAYAGETTAARFRRNCDENNVSYRMIGDSDIRMGPQPIGTIKEILQDCADTEHGMIFESRDDFGLTMLTLDAMYNQGDEIRIAPDIPVTATGTSSSITMDSDYDAWFWDGVTFQVRVASTDTLVTSSVFTVTGKRTSGSNIIVDFTPTIGTTPTTSHIVTTVRSGLLELDFEDKEIGFPFKPVKDDRLVANSVTVSRKNGSAITTTLDVGPRSTTEPPEGIGLYEVQATLGVASDDQLEEHAGWLLGLGTNDDARFPDLLINLHRRSLAARQADLLSSDIGHLITVDNAAGAYIYDQIRQIGRGYTETFDGNKIHYLSWNTVHGRPYDILRYDSNLRLVGQGTSLTTGYLIAAETPAREVKDGQRARLRTSTGALKQSTLFTVSVGVTAGGFTNINITPNASAVTNSGDVLEIIREDSRYAANSTVLGESLTTTQTGAVSVSVGEDVWTTSVWDFPMDVKIGGERVTLSAISGGSGSIAFIGTGTSSSGNNASIAAGLPTGAANGHTVFLLASIRNDSATVNTPTNWTVVHSSGNNTKLMARTYNGVWTMPTVTFSGGSSGDTTIVQSVAYSGVTASSAVTNTPTSGVGDDIRVSTNKMDSVAGQYGLRLACGIKFDDWTTVVPPTGLDEIQSVTTTTGNDMSQSWAYAIDTSSGNFAGATGSFTTTGGAAASYESFVVFFPSAPQTFTISARSVNGVVKTHSVGASVDVADPSNYGLGS